MEQTLEDKQALSDRHHQQYRYYADKKYCQIDMDILQWKYGSDNHVPTSHPIIKFMLFLRDIKDRNRFQEYLAEIERHNSFEMARRIYATSTFSLEGVKQELDERIRKLQIKIEKFHAEYCI